MDKTSLNPDIRMELTDKEAVLEFIKKQEKKWIYIKFNCWGSHSISGVYTKMKIRSIEENDLVYIYGEEDQDRLTIAWDEVIQMEMTPSKDEVLIRIPHIDVYIKKYQSITSVITELPMINKHMIMTEGKTDWKILKAALRYFQSHGKYLDLDVNFVELEKNDLGGGYRVLQKVRDYNAIFPNEKLRIFIFDADVEQVNREHEGSENGYKSWGNNVYSFILPVPESRKATPLISIENYFSDSDIKTMDENGRRLFIKGEFGENGRLKDDREIITSKVKKNQPENLIIDDMVFRNKDLDITRENVVKKATLNGYPCIALSKNCFADNILNKKGKFANVNFENFTLIFDVIESIFKKYNIGDVLEEEISHGIYLQQAADGFENLSIGIGLPNTIAHKLKTSGIMKTEIERCTSNLKIKIGMELESGEYCWVEVPVVYSEKIIGFMKRKVESTYNRIYLRILDEERNQVRSCELLKGENATIIILCALRKIEGMKM